MKILFTSDIHGITKAYKEFTHILKMQDFDCGVIAGDNQRELLPDNEILELLDLDLEEFKRDTISDPFKFQSEALTKEVENLFDILNEAGKPIFIISGNHDKAEYTSKGKVYVLNNIRALKFKNYKFIGYQKTSFETDIKEIEKDCKILKKVVDNKTILITHAPAYGILDYTLRNENVGEKALRDVLDSKKPVAHLFGHIHENAGHVGLKVNGSFARDFDFFSVDLENEEIKTIKSSFSRS